MACIVNLTVSVKPELRAEFLHELSLILLRHKIIWRVSLGLSQREFR